MAAIGPNFYALNGVRGYPIDDAALGQDDNGHLLPPGILVDCRLRFPWSAGGYAFLGALTVTARLTTVLFLASDSSGAGTAVPLASATVVAPVDPWRPYPVAAIYPGTGGWIVFGPGVEEPYVGRFSSARQSRLLSRCARPYRVPPIPSIGKEYVAGPLTGIVKVLAGADLEIFKDQREIGDRPADCLVIRLADDLNRNVLEVYSGPCAGRPESGTCVTPALEQINAIGPDCDGNINIQFRGATAVPLRDGGGLVVGLPLGLTAVCAGKYLPDAAGRLPTEFDNLCSSESLHLSASLAAPTHAAVQATVPVRGATPPPWPAADNFVTPDPRWQVVDGTASPALPPMRPALVLRDHSRRNTVLWGREVYETVGLSCRTRVRSHPGTGSNGGIVVNHRIRLETGRPDYYLVLVDAAANNLDLLHYNGAMVVTLTSVAIPAFRPVLPGDEYEINVTTRAVGGDVVAIEAVLTIPGRDGPGVRLVYVVRDYAPAKGRFGLGTVRSSAAFTYFDLRGADG